MKITVNGRQPLSILKKADQVRVSEKDIEVILDYIEKIPEKTIIYTAPLTLENENIAHFWNTLEMYNDKLDDFIIELQDARQFSLFKERGFKVFWKYPISTYYDLQAVIAQDPAYIVLGEPLCFELQKVKNVTRDIPLRMTVNYAYEPYIERKDGLCGKWVRPEDIPIYEEYIDAIDFRVNKNKEEEILLSTYRKQEWPGNINLLITNLNRNADNRAFPDDFGERRANCGQICMKTGNCHYCETAMILNKILRERHDSMKDSDEI